MVRDYGADSEDEGSALLYAPSSRPDLSEAARCVIARGLVALYAPVLAEEPGGKLPELLDMLGKAISGAPKVEPAS